MAHVAGEQQLALAPPVKSLIAAVAAFFGTIFACLAITVWHVTGEVTIDKIIGGHAPYATGRALYRLLAGWEGPAVMFLVTALLLATALARRDRFSVWLCAVGPLLAWCVCEVLAKPVIDRHKRLSFSFPSGHTTLAAALATLIVIVAYRFRGGSFAAAVAPFTLVIPCTTGLAVVRLGSHFPTDALGGVALGVGIVCGVAVFLDRTFPQKSHELVKAD